MVVGEDTFMEQGAPTVHVQGGRLAVLSVALQVTHRLVGVGDVDHVTAVRARQIKRHISMIDRAPMTGQGPKPSMQRTDLHTTMSPTALTEQDLGPGVLDRLVRPGQE